MNKKNLVICKLEYKWLICEHTFVILENKYKVCQNTKTQSVLSQSKIKTIKLKLSN